MLKCPLCDETLRRPRGSDPPNAALAQHFASACPATESRAKAGAEDRPPE